MKATSRGSWAWSIEEAPHPRAGLLTRELKAYEDGETSDDKGIWLGGAQYFTGPVKDGRPALRYRSQIKKERYPGR